MTNSLLAVDSLSLIFILIIIFAIIGVPIIFVIRAFITSRGSIGNKTMLELYGDKQLDLEIEEFLNQIHIEVECCKNDMDIEDLEDIIPDKVTFKNR